MEQPGVVAGNFALSFSLNQGKIIFWAFLCLSKAPFGRSLWSEHHWKDLFLLQNLSIDDANFGQKCWLQKWKKGQGSSRAVTGSTGVNVLSRSLPASKAIGYDNIPTRLVKDGISKTFVYSLQFFNLPAIAFRQVGNSVRWRQYSRKIPNISRKITDP